MKLEFMLKKKKTLTFLAYVNNFMFPPTSSKTKNLFIINFRPHDTGTDSPKWLFFGDKSKNKAEIIIN